MRSAPETARRTAAGCGLDRRGPLRAAAALALALAAAAPLAALETDQYLVWGRRLNDSTAAVNAFVNAEAEALVAELAGRDLPCRAVPRRLYRRLFPTLLHSRLRKFLLTDPAVDRFPDREVGYFRYYRLSIYRHLAFPFFLPLGRTVKIDGVHVGVDKLAGHMLGFGRRYYVRYLRLRRRGASEEEALRRVVEWGLQIEKLFVGGLIDGIFSHADLEANYQGLRLALDFCDGPRPYLRRRAGGGWELARPIDLADYVGPLWDESYNNSHFIGRRWRGVRKVLLAEVCPRTQSDEVRALLSRYHAESKPSLSRQIVAEHFRARGRDRQLEQSLDRVCGAVDGGAPILQIASASLPPPAAASAAER